MSLAITIELGDADLQHFIDAMQRAQQEAKNLSSREITDAASRLLVEGHQTTLPHFIAERLSKLDSMIAMVHDTGFALPQEECQRVLACLAYFANPHDIIPDGVPVLGFLDDAIMIELCVRELRHELDAYDDFCEFRAHEATKRGVEPSAVGQADWLESRREELVDRMHTRRERDVGVGYGSSSGYGGRRSYTRAWRPGLFTFK